MRRFLLVVIAVGAAACLLGDRVGDLSARATALALGVTAVISLWVGAGAAYWGARAERQVQDYRGTKAQVPILRRGIVPLARRSVAYLAGGMVILYVAVKAVGAGGGS